MPLFFIISGYLLNEHSLLSYSYMKKKCIILLTPYITYLVVDTVLINKIYSIKSFVKVLWGGRAISGTYWYITCFVFTLFLFRILLKYMHESSSEKRDIRIGTLIFVGGGIAVIESHLAERIHFLESPGIPWNLDVSLLALVYLAIGFYYYKDKIREIFRSENKRLDVTAFLLILGLVIFCYLNYRNGEPFYYFDMKPIYYKELFSAILIPCAFGFVIARIIHWICKYKALDWLTSGFAYLGQMTIPIMFMHVPLNTWKETIGYGRLVYVLIGVGIPVAFTLIFNRYSIMRKLFGLPKLKRYNDVPNDSVV